jgi:hypothetical protein
LSEIRATTISDAAGTGPITLTKQYGVKMWARFRFGNSIDESFNVSSLTDNTTGRSSLNFTSSMSSSTYSIAACPNYPTSGAAEYWTCIGHDKAGNGTNTTKVSLTHTYGDENEDHFWDGNDASASVIGDLA